jgi:hypothetical protein
MPARMSAPAYNRSIRGLLADLSTLNPNIGPEELICMWFDDLYIPSQERPVSYSPEVWERGLREWRGCFSDDELRILDRFHQAYASLVDELPTRWPEWEQDARWQSVKEAAAAALHQLEPGAGGMPSAVRKSYFMHTGTYEGEGQ